MVETRLRIKVKEIRKGDLIRQEKKSHVVGKHTAIEFVASYDGDSFWIDAGADTFLLDRSVMLPTKPYAVVAPPEESDGILSPYILRPFGKGLDWYRAGTFAHDYEVLDDLKNGWRVVFEGVENE